MSDAPTQKVPRSPAEDPTGQVSRGPAEQPTRTASRGPAATPPGRQPPSWLATAVGMAGAFLAGILLVVAARGVNHDPPARTTTVTKTVAGPTVTLPGRTTTVPAGSSQAGEGPVPDVVGAQLDEAKSQLGDAGYDTEITSGGGLLGPIDDSTWTVIGQDPPAGEPLARGETVGLDIERK